MQRKVSKISITSQTTQAELENLEAMDIIGILHDPCEAIVRAIPNGSNLIISHVADPKSVGYLERIECTIHLVNPTKAAAKAIPNGSTVVISATTSAESVNWLQEKKCVLILKNPSKLTAEAIPDGSKVLIDSYTDQMAVESLAGKNCLFILETPLELVVKAIPDGSRVEINSFTITSLEWLQGKNCDIHLIDPSENLVKTIPNGSNVTVSATTQTAAVNWLQGKNCVFHLFDPPESVVKAIPDGSQIVIHLITNLKIIDFLKAKQCVIHPISSAKIILNTQTEDVNEKEKKPIGKIKKKSQSEMTKKEIPHAEFTRYFSELNKKLKNKNSIIKNMIEGYQDLTLILNSKMENHALEEKLIKELKSIPKVNYVISLNNSIQISFSIVRSDFEKVKKILNEYESKKIEMASSDQEKTYLFSLQNRIQAKGYVLKLNCVDEIWTLEWMMDSLSLEESKKWVEQLSLIQGIKVNGNQLTFTEELSASDFVRVQTILNDYENNLKKIEKSDSTKPPIINNKAVERKENYPSSSYLHEKPNPKNQTVHPKKKKPKGQSHPKKSSHAHPKLQHPKLKQDSNPDRQMPISTPLTIEEKNAMEKIKEMSRKDSELKFLTDAELSISNSMPLSTSNIPVSNSQHSFFSSSSKASVKSIHCVYNGADHIGSFTYPLIFSSSMKQLKYILNLNEVVKTKVNDQISDAEYYGLIQLLEITQKLFEFQNDGNKNSRFSTKILDMGLVIMLRDQLKPSNLLRYKENEILFKKFKMQLCSFRDSLMENLDSILIAYENNNTLSLHSMKHYHDLFETMRNQLDKSLTTVNQLSKKEKVSNQKILEDLLSRYTLLNECLTFVASDTERVICENELKYVVIGIADLSEKQYPDCKNHLLGLISLRNRFMHVMEYDGGRVMRDLSHDVASLTSPDFLASIEFLKSMVQKNLAMVQTF